jgi:hypothetical protein
MVYFDAYFLSYLRDTILWIARSTSGSETR